MSPRRSSAQHGPQPHPVSRTQHRPGEGPGRRTVLRRAAVTGLGLAGAGLTGVGAWAAGDALGASGGSPEPAALRIGYLPITDAAPLLVGHARGLFAQEGAPTADPILFRSWASLCEAFISSEVDAIHLLMPLAFHLRYGLGADARVMAWNHVNGSALTVAPEIRDVAQLAGRTVAVPAWWSVHNVLLQRLLRDAGLRPVIRRSPEAQETALVVMSPADMLPALHQRTISGFVVADPFNAAATARGVGKTLRFLGDVWRHHACCVTVLRGDLVDDAPERTEAFLRGLVRAQAWTREHREEASRLLADGLLPQPQPIILRALTDHPDAASAVHHRDWAGELIDFVPYPFPGFTTRLLEEMRATVVDAPRDFLDGLDAARVHEDLVVTGPVRAAIEELGGSSVFGLDGYERTEQLDG